MFLARLRLRDFRNYQRLDAEFGPGVHVLVGDNAQGKTNILEAIYLVATLRSFRGAASPQLIRHGQKGYFVGAEVTGQLSHEIKIYWSRHERNLVLDGQPVRRLSDYLGVLRAVVFCSEDIQLIKGTGRVRRRFLDLLLAHTRTDYLALRQRYAAALRARNSLLRSGGDARALEGFTVQLTAAGERITQLRRDLVARLAPLVQGAYRDIAAQTEDLAIDYAPGVKSDFLAELAQAREREAVYRSTMVGPHRDDVRLTLNGHPAAVTASEGQKRTIAIALKLAQAHFLTAHLGAAPLLLIDDIMGELDQRRRAAFFPLLAAARTNRSQVFLTCTEQNWPHDLAAGAHVWRVEGGHLVTLRG